MIYKFRVVSDEVELFARNIEINAESTFLQLHEAIQASVKFDSTQLASFYIGDKDWTRGQQITLLDMSDADDDTLLMSDVMLTDHIKKVNDNLVYVFDFFNDRAFYVTLAEIKKVDPKAHYPQSIGAIGEAPKQVAIGDFSADMLGADFDYAASTGEEFDLDEFNEHYGYGEDDEEGGEDEDMFGAGGGGSWDSIDDYQDKF